MDKVAIKRVRKDEKGKLKPYYIDVETLQPISDIKGYKIINPDGTPEFSGFDAVAQAGFFEGILPSTPGSPTNLSDDKKEKKEVGKEEVDPINRNRGEKPSKSSGNTKGSKPSGANNFGYINKPDWLGLTGMLPGAPGMLGKAVNLGINTNNVSAINTARNYLGLDDLSPMQTVGGLVKDRKGFLDRVKINNQEYDVGLEAMHKNNTTLTPDEARVRGLTLGGIKDMQGNTVMSAIADVTVESMFQGKPIANENALREALAERREMRQEKMTEFAQGVVTPSNIPSSIPGEVTRTAPISQVAANVPQDKPFTRQTLTEENTPTGGFLNGTPVEQGVVTPSSLPGNVSVNAASAVTPGSYSRSVTPTESGIPTSVATESRNLTPDTSGLRETIGNRVNYREETEDGTPVGLNSQAVGFMGNYGPRRPNAPKESVIDNVKTSVGNVFGPGSTVVGISGMGEYGSHRHRLGDALDADVYDAQGVRQTNNIAMQDVAMDFAARNPTAGIGLGKGYMADGRIHLDTANDPAAWGANGLGANMDPTLKDNIDFARQTGIGPTPTFNAPTPTPKGMDAGPATATGDFNNLNPTEHQNVFADLNASVDSYAKGLVKDNVQSPALSEDKFSGLNQMSPAEMAAKGLLSRTPEERQAIAKTLVGELSPSALKGLMAGEEAAQKELANMITTVENRAYSQKYGTLKDALRPDQYNSLMPGAIKTTMDNWTRYGDVVLSKVDSYYTPEGIKPDNYGFTSYHANYTNPSWSGLMGNQTLAGEHKFGTLGEYGPGMGFLAERTRQFNAQIADTRGFTPADMASSSSRTAARANQLSNSSGGGWTSGFGGVRGTEGGAARSTGNSYGNSSNSGGGGWTSNGRGTMGSEGGAARSGGGSFGSSSNSGGSSSSGYGRSAPEGGSSSKGTGGNSHPGASSGHSSTPGGGGGHSGSKNDRGGYAGL